MMACTMRTVRSKFSAAVGVTWGQMKPTKQSLRNASITRSACICHVVAVTNEALLCIMSYMAFLVLCGIAYHQSTLPQAWTCFLCMSCYHVAMAASVSFQHGTLVLMHGSFWHLLKCAADQLQRVPCTAAIESLFGYSDHSILLVYLVKSALNIFTTHGWILSIHYEA